MTYVCTICLRKFMLFKFFLAHIRECPRNSLRLQCNSCKESYYDFLDVFALIDEMKCENCNDLSFDDFTSLNNQIAEQGEIFKRELPFDCPHCHYRFTLKNTLNAHIRTRHRSEIPK